MFNDNQLLILMAIVHTERTATFNPKSETETKALEFHANCCVVAREI